MDAFCKRWNNYKNKARNFLSGNVVCNNIRLSIFKAQDTQVLPVYFLSMRQILSFLPHVRITGDKH